MGSAVSGERWYARRAYTVGEYVHASWRLADTVRVPYRLPRTGRRETRDVACVYSLKSLLIRDIVCVLAWTVVAV